MDTLKEWLIVVIGGLVTKPELVDIVVTQDEMGVLFSVSVAKEDAGKVIGKGGVIAQAIRTLLRSAGFLKDMRASMKVNAEGSKFELKDGE